MLTTAERRLYLRVTLKLLGLTAVLFVAATLFASLQSPPTGTGPVVTVPLAELAPGEPRRVDWGGRPILVLRRSPAQTAALTETGLAAPVAPPHPELLVAYAVGRGAGCALALEGNALRDRCDGVRYDLAGRVFTNQPVARNLAVPPHRVRDGHLVIGTEG